MAKLYRGLQTKPKILIPKLADEYEELYKLRKEIAGRHPKDLMGAFREMGEDRMQRFFDLAQIAGPQFFTDEEKAARDFAGEKGFVITVDVDDETASRFYQGTQVMAKGSGYVSNFVIPGKELAQHLEDWKVDMIDIEKENSEGKPPAEGESTRI